MGGAEPQELRDEIERLTGALSFAEHQLVQREARCRELELRLRTLRQPVVRRLAGRSRAWARRVLPRATRRGAVLTRFARVSPPPGILPVRAAAARLTGRIRGRITGAAAAGAAGGEGDWPDGGQYREWLARHQPGAGRPASLRERSEAWEDPPQLSLIMTLEEDGVTQLETTVDALRAQTYAHWQLCVEGGAATIVRTRAVLEGGGAADARITLLAAGSGDPGLATALETATGAWVATLDPGDRLPPHALHRVAERLRDQPGAGILYSDEDRLLADGSRAHVFFKPDWSPDLLLAGNYLGRLTLIRRDLVTSIGGPRLSGGPGEHDLLLRAVETGCRVDHVADVLCSRGASGRPPPHPPGVADPGAAVIEQALRRRAIRGRVVPAARPGWHHVRREIAGRPRVGIIIPTRDRADLLRACLGSVAQRSSYDRYSVLIVDNDSREGETLRYLDSCGHRVLRHPGNFNYAAIINRAAAELDCDQLVFLNNDVTVITPGWMEAMLEQSQRPEVGAVGCRLLFPDGRVQHEGVGLGQDGPATNLGSGALFGLGHCIREVSAVSGACMMIDHSLFDAMGGLDEHLRVSFNDVDLCLRLRERGHRIIYTPLAELHHDEGSSRGAYDPPDDWAHFLARWGPWQELEDPYVNRNIARTDPLRLRLG